MEWLHRQVLHDLRCVALACGDSKDRIVGLISPPDRPEVEEILLSVLDDRHLDCPVGVMGNTVRKLLQIGAWQQFDDPDLATFSIAILLADVWNTGIGFGSPDQDWPDLSSFIMNISSTRRAVLLRAYFELHQMSRYQADSFLNPRQFPTENADSIITTLCRLARNMSEDDLTIIAQADYGYDFEKHLATLRDVINQPDCRFPKDMCCYPTDVVELVGFAPEKAGFVGCTALLIINDIISSGHHDYMSFRWENEPDVYCSLPAPLREPILRGIRHLYETAIDRWGPYTFGTYKKRDKQAICIPYFDSGGTA